MSSKWRGKDRNRKALPQSGPAVPNTPEGILRQQGLLTAQIQASMFSGPLPPPEQLEHYEKVHRGLAERIVSMTERQFAMAERQGAHRIDIENRFVKHNIILSYLGWFSGFSLGAGGLIAAVILISRGRELGGGAAFVTSVGTLAGLFFYGRRKQGDDLAKKRPE